MKFMKASFFTIHKYQSGKIEAIRQHGWRFAVPDSYCEPCEYIDVYMHKDKPSHRWMVDCPFTGYNLMVGFRDETRESLAQRFIDSRLDAYLRIIHKRRDFLEKLEAQYLEAVANRGDEDD